MPTPQTPKHVADRKEQSCNCQLFCECPEDECIRGAIEEKFTYQAPHGNQVPRYEKLRDEHRRLASLVFYKCPPSSERRRAIEALQEAMMWANASIAVNECEATLEAMPDYEQPVRYRGCCCGSEDACSVCLP